MTKLFIALTLFMALFTTTTLQAATLPVNQPQQTTNPLKAIPVTGTNTTGGAFTGVLDITKFAVKNGGVVAIGTLNGTLTNTVNGVTTEVGKIVNQIVTLPVTPGNATCEILNLQIGAISLNLLGLQIDLAPISLVITAQQGSGNLLGNLLCAVAKLLDGNGNAFGRLAGLLNDILRLLG